MALPIRRTVQFKLQSWQELNCSSADHDVLNLLVCLIIWEIWKSRNHSLHEGKNIPTLKLCERILSSLRIISQAFPFSTTSASLTRILQIHVKTHKLRSYSSVCWKPPNTDRVKLNVDGSSNGNPGQSGGGGIIRNHSGTPLLGFWRYYGLMTSLLAECCALREGVELCLQNGFTSVDVETDSLLLLNMLTDKSPISWQLDFDIRHIQRITAGLNFAFSHIYREANATADLLASQASSFKTTLFFDNNSIPQVIKGQVALDAIQFPYIRVR